MNPNQLSPNTRKALQALVQLIREGKIPEEFDILWSLEGAVVITPEKKFLSIQNRLSSSFTLKLFKARGFYSVIRSSMRVERCIGTVTSLRRGTA
jgi:hypothetical protein